MNDVLWAASMPELYDGCLGPALFAPYAAQLGEHAARVPVRSVLELAAGSGITTAELVRRLPDAKVLATDLNRAMVDFGAARVPAAQWRTADAGALPLPDASVDLIVCSFGVMFFPDKQAAFAEAARVLVPSGHLLFSVWDAIDTCPFPAALAQAVATVLPQDSPDFVSRIPHGYADADRIRAELLGGGLETDYVERVAVVASAQSAATLAEGFCLGTPLRFALEQRGDLAELTAAIAAEMTELLGTGTITGPLSAFVIRARVQ